MNDGAITSEFLSRIPLPQPAEDGNKDQRGRVLVIAGSPSVPGAALLAATAALRAGAGKLQIATCQSIATHLGLAVPEALVLALPETASGEIDPRAAVLLRERIARCDAVLIGPGMLDEDAVSALTADLLDCNPGSAFVLDAGALGQLKEIVAVLARHEGRMVITPHAGEMANLLGVDKQDVLAPPQPRSLAKRRACSTVSWRLRGRAPTSPRRTGPHGPTATAMSAWRHQDRETRWPVSSQACWLAG